MNIKTTILYLLLLASCAREYSRESNGQPPLPADTIYNNLITSCSIYIADNSMVRIIYAEARTKLAPGSYIIFDSVLINSESSSLYKDTFDLKNYYPMNIFYKGDYFVVRYQIRWRFLPAQFVQYDTLIY